MARIHTKSYVIGFALSLIAQPQMWTQTPPAKSVSVRIVSGNLPTYPPIAKAAAIGGTVHLTLTIQRGTVARAMVDPSTDISSRRWLAPSSRSYALSWRFPNVTSGTIRAEFTYVSTPPGSGDEIDIRMAPTQGIVVLLKASRPKPTVIVDPMPLPPAH